MQKTSYSLEQGNQRKNNGGIGNRNVLVSQLAPKFLCLAKGISRHYFREMYIFGSKPTKYTLLGETNSICHDMLGFCHLKA